VPLRAIIFDYGHTLINFAPAEDALVAVYEEIRRLLEAEAYQDLPAAPELVTALSGRVYELVAESYRRQELEELDIVNLFDTALNALGITLPTPLTRQIAEMEHRALVSGLQREDSNLQVLFDLRRQDLRIGLVSNAHFIPELMREDIERLGIAELVDASVFSSELGVRKPHPAIFRHVLDALDVRPDESIFVGDRLRDDISGAKRLGMRAVLTHQFRQEEVIPELPEPDLVIQRLPDLLPYIHQLRLEPEDTRTVATPSS
jgi:putative hydrolase of the HAD superfamily